MPFRSLAVTLLLFSCNLPAQISTLNLSHDLVKAGIASSNMTPGQPSLDSRPLIEAAFTYAAANRISNLIADPGTYYFLSMHNTNTHVLINAASNVLLDLQNSDLLFANSNVAAIQCTNCTGVTFANFTVDYKQLPFTQVTVASVNSAAQSFTYQTIAGYQDPSAFNNNRAPDGSDAIYMFVFRNGVPIQQVGRMTAKRPVSGGVIAISDTKDPWAAPSAMSSMQPGDTVVFSDRSGPPVLNIVNGSNVTIQGVSIYAAGQIALYFGRTNGATADHVQVIPRPGTSRLISANADGLHTSFALGPNVYTNNIVRRTCDDAVAIAAPWLAAVTQVNGTTVTVTRNFSSPFPPGVSIGFVDPSTAAVIGTATIVSESPAYAQQTLTDGETVTLTLSKAISGLAANAGITDTDAVKLGSGSIIAYNTIQEGVFSRGVWLAGVDNISVHDNFIQRTSSDGIFIQQLGSATDNTQAGPSSGVTIQNNLVDSSIAYGNVSHGVALAAASIATLSENSQNAQVTTSPHSNIVVTGNRVTNAARTAIRLENVNGGQIQGNTIQGFGLAPAVNVFTAPSCCEVLSQYQADFAQAMLTPASVSVTAGSNTVSPVATLIQNLSTASGYPRLAVGSFAAAYGTNLAAAPLTASGASFPTSLGGVTVSITDSTGVTQEAPIQYVSPGQVNYIVPAGMAPGIATLTIGPSSGAAQIDSVGPGLYSLNGTTGVAAATASLYSADGTNTPVAVFQCSPVCTATPMSLGGAGQMLVITLYGTGFRNATSATASSVTIGGVPAQILYLGAQPTDPGLDQVNVVVPPALAGAGEVPVILNVGGQTANTVTLSFK